MSCLEINLMHPKLNYYFVLVFSKYFSKEKSPGIQRDLRDRCPRKTCDWVAFLKGIGVIKTVVILFLRFLLEVRHATQILNHVFPIFTGSKEKFILFH